MKKYTVLKPMITSNKKLLLNGDVIYIYENQLINKCGNKYTQRKVFSSVTRDYIGELKNEDNLQIDL